MILSGQSIRGECSGESPMLSPFCSRGVQNGKSYGLSVAGYDIRLDKLEKPFWYKEVDGSITQGFYLDPGQFILGSSVERFKMPNDIIGFVKDKSSWARKGISVFNTVIEPGWEGYLTLEIVNHGPDCVLLFQNDPIAQVVFQWLDQPAEKGYSGKYQNQENKPVGAKYEN